MFMSHKYVVYNTIIYIYIYTHPRLDLPHQTKTCIYAYLEHIKISNLNKKTKKTLTLWDTYLTITISWIILNNIITLEYHRCFTFCCQASCPGWPSGLTCCRAVPRRRSTAKHRPPRSNATNTRATRASHRQRTLPRSGAMGSKARDEGKVLGWWRWWCLILFECCFLLKGWKIRWIQRGLFFQIRNWDLTLVSACIVICIM